MKANTKTTAVKNNKIEESPKSIIEQIIEEAMDQTTMAGVICNEKGYVIYRTDKETYISLSIAKIVRIDEPQPVLRIRVVSETSYSYEIAHIDLEQVLTLITQK